ncbi:MAG: GMC family oxidoreductase [Acidobacteria bacterium]|nr:GMC family oxidoreductase [Acidobacteriota bacterium]
MFQVKTTRNQKLYDAIIIGSGASGGMAAKELTEKGMEVLVLEAGPPVNPARDFSMHTWPYEDMYRGFGPPGWRNIDQWMEDTAGHFSRHFYVKDSENPYTTEPGKPFLWVRARIVGGKTLHWGRLSWRLSDLDFKAASHDGFDVDWPIDYKEIEPYYDKVEEFVGVSGNHDNLWYQPNGKYLPPMNLTCGEQLLKKGSEKLGRPGITSRVSMLTAVKPHHKKYNRAACHYCGHCGDGCDVGAMFSSVSSTLPVAAATGKMTLRPNSVVRHINVDPKTGNAKGVSVVDRVTYQELEFQGKVIIVAGSTLESTRLLLNSKSRQHPNGVGNSSGVLGHYLVDHFGGISGMGVFPTLAGRDPVNEDGKAAGLFIPRFRNLDAKTKHPKFLRGYGFECSSGMGRNPGAGRFPGFGKEFKETVRKWSTAPVYMTTRANMLSRFENFVEIDPGGTVDAWGIPVLKIHIQHSDNEREMAKDAAECIEETLKSAGAEIISVGGNMTAPGKIIHELGTARMGNDKKTSVLNKWNQTHDVKNVFVTDGAAFIGAANQNPTITIMALTMRACDYIEAEMKRGNL